MLKSIIHFVADFPVVLFVNGINIGSLQKSYHTLSIEVEEEKSLMLEIKPISSNNFYDSICYMAEIVIFDGNIKTNSRHLEITNYDGINFEIKVLPINVLLNKTEKVVEEIKINNDMQAVFFDNGVFYVEINTKNKVFRYALKEKINNIKIDHFNQNNTEFLLFCGKTPKNQDYLIIFGNFFCNLEICADVIEISHTEIKVLNYQNDIARHATIQIYSFKNGELVLSDTYTAFVDGEAHTTQDTKLIPLAFCEAIKIGNTKLARSYLDQNLNEMLSDEHLLTFFGDHNKIQWNKYGQKEQTICFLYGSKNKTCKTYYFEIKENKITNITYLD